MEASGSDAAGSLASGSVVIGFDGRRPPSHLLSAAVDQAIRRDVDLAIVTVVPDQVDEPDQPDLPEAEAATMFAEEPDAWLQLRSDIKALHAQRPELRVRAYRLTESEARSDHEPLTSAKLLVIGAHGRGGQALGPETVSWVLLRTARCPVLIVPDEPSETASTDDPRRPARRPIVLAGLSGKLSDPFVLGEAVAESQRRGGDLQFLHAYSPRVYERPDQALQRALDVVVRALGQERPAAALSVVLTQESPSTALCRLAADAAILVIGGRSGSMAGLIPGSVSRVVIANAPGLVLAVPWLLIDRHSDRSPHAGELRSSPDPRLHRTFVPAAWSPTGSAPE
jgi:nucleotide-binding universal stress UspA family protein